MEILHRPQERWYGLYTSISDVLRSADAASDTLNSYLSKSQSHRKRFGSKVVFKPTSGVGGGGTAEYRYVSATDGSVGYEKIIIGSTLSKIKTGTLALTYSGSATSVTCSVLYDTSANEWKFYLFEDEVVTFSYSLGIGFDEASPVTLTTLTAAIDALSTFAAVNTGSGSLPAAFLPTLSNEPFNAGALTLSYEYESAIIQPATAANPFAAHLAQRNTVDYEMVSTSNVNNVLYFNSPYVPEKKYDGQKVYNSGMPKPATPSASVVPNATGRTGTNIKYRVAFVQYDNRNNRQEGVISEPTANVSPAADYVDVTYTPLTPSTGYNTDAAMVVANQVGVTTINVDNGSGGAHTLKVGDTAYFYDGVSAGHVSRTITAVAANTITISGANVNVFDNNPISANLRVVLYAQSVTDGDYYFIDEFPHNSWLGTTTVRDEGTVALDEVYIFPDPGTEPGLPPQGKYGVVFKGIKFIAGVLATPDTVYFSDILSPESFPSASSNSFTIKTGQQEAFTGLLASNEFLHLFKGNSSHILTADIDAETASLRFRVDEISLSVGCASHHTIKQLDDGAIVFLSQQGLYRIHGASLPERISELVLPFFSKRITGEAAFIYKRAWGVYSPLENWYLLFMPAESLNGSDRYSNDSSRLLLCDFSNSFALSVGDRQIELPFVTVWNACDFTCGAFVKDRDFYFVERRFSSFDSAVTYKLRKFIRRDDDYDYIDHNQAVQWSYTTGWDVPINRSTFVLPTRLKIFSSDPEVSIGFNLEVNVVINFKQSIIGTMNYDFGIASANGYSYAPWSTSPWGAPSEAELDGPLPRVKANALQFTFSNANTYQGALVTGWETEFSTPFKKAMNE